MKTIRDTQLLGTILFLLAIPFAVFAQDGTRTPAGETFLLKEGTEANLKFAQDISSKTAAEDDRVNFELAEDLKVGDVTVAKAGAKAVGTVTHVKKAGMMGKGGELNVRLEYVKIGDSRIRLRAKRQGWRRQDRHGSGAHGLVWANRVDKAREECRSEIRRSAESVRG